MTDLDVVVLGVGAGATAVFHGEASSSFVICQRGQPILLLDAVSCCLPRCTVHRQDMSDTEGSYIDTCALQGLGAVSACIRHTGSIPDHIYISHNHTDHSGELPVLLAVERQRGRRLNLYAEAGVMGRLTEHRLHELVSTGRCLGMNLG
jgi:ribonuclease BN (tRNA processing enzyme)